jgi:hypothetical protein
MSKNPPDCMSPKTLLSPLLRCQFRHGYLLGAIATYATITAPTTSAIAQTPNNIQDFDLSPEVINSSPVLRKWGQEVPDVGADIDRDPSFRTRIKVGYATYPSANALGGFYGGIEDLLIGSTGLSLSAHYDSGSDNTNRRTSYGADAKYYLLPLGGYVNIAPIVGYSRLETSLYQREGLKVGAQFLLVPARGGGGDIALSQTWLGLGTDREVGLTKLSIGYAVTNNLRLSTEIQQQNAREQADSRVGIGIELMFP